MISLTDSEVVVCRMIAKLRYEAARKAGVVDKRIDNSGEFLDLDGFGAELAFCKMFNVYPDFSVGARKGGYDALTKLGRKVDVKQTKYVSGHLLAHRDKKLGESDIYVLMIGVLPNYRFAGFVEEKELLDEMNLKDLGHGEGYALPQQNLTKLDQKYVDKLLQEGGE